MLLPNLKSCEGWRGRRLDKEVMSLRTETGLLKNLLKKAPTSFMQMICK